MGTRTTDFDHHTFDLQIIPDKKTIIILLVTQSCPDWGRNKGETGKKGGKRETPILNNRQTLN